jgi:hypothetical protein
MVEGLRPLAWLVFLCLATGGASGADANSGGFSLLSYRGSIAAQAAQAVCLKARDGAGGGESPLRAFCFYWVGGSNSQLLRSDDTGVGGPVQKAGSTAGPAFGRWLKSIDPSYVIKPGSVTVLLDRLQTGPVKAADLQALLPDSRSPRIDGHDSSDLELGKVANMAELIKDVESRLKTAGSAPQVSPAGTTQAPPPATSVTKGVASKAGSPPDSLTKTLARLTDGVAGVKASLEKLKASLEKATALAFFLVLGFLAVISALVVLTLVAVLRRPAAGSMPLPYAAAPDLEAALAVLDEPLAREGQSAEGVLGKARALSSLVQDARGRVIRIAGRPAETSLDAGLGAIEESLQAISREYQEGETLEAGTPSNVAAMVRRWQRLIGTLAVCGHKIAELASTYGGSESRTGGTWEERLTSQLEGIELLLQDYQGALAAIAALGLSRDELPSAVKSFGQLLGDLRERFGDRDLTLAAARERLGALWTGLDQAAIGQGQSYPMPGPPGDPGTILSRLVGELESRRGALAKAQQELLLLNQARQAMEPIEEALSPFRYPDESTLRSVQRLLAENCGASEVLHQIGGPEQEGLIARARSVSHAVSAARTEVRRVLPDAHGALEQVVSQLTSAYDARRGSQLLQVELIGELCRSVELEAGNPGDPVGLRGLLGAVQLEATGPHRQLRLGLCAALIVWNEEVHRLQQERREDVITALQLKEIQEALPPILALLQNRPTESLLDGCLAEGFSQQGFHRLFRAETLLNTYFHEAQSFDGIRECANLAGAAVRAALRRLCCDVQMIGLLRPVQFLPQEGLESRPEASPELRRVKEVWTRVHALLDRAEFVEAAIDVQLFLRRERSEVKGTCRVISLNPGEWRTFEGAAT